MSMASHKNWFERNPKKTFLIIGVLCLLLAELVLQGHFYLRNKTLVSQRTWRVAEVEPTDDEREYAPRKGFTSGSLHINEAGYRGELVEGDPDILTLGDSVPFGYGVGDEESYPYYLSKDYGLKVINGGVSSYTFWQSLVRWQKDFGHLKPKIVTFQSTNDLPLIMHFRRKWHPRITWLEVRWDKREVAPNFLLRNSALYYYLDQAMNQGPVQADDDQYFKPLEGELTKKLFQNMSDSLDRVIQYGQETGAVIVLVSANPFWYTDDLEKNKNLKFWTRHQLRGFPIGFPMYQMTNVLLKDKASKREGVYYFDIVGKMNQLDRNELFRDAIHYSPRGNREFARLFHEFLKDKRLLENV